MQFMYDLKSVFETNNFQVLVSLKFVLENLHYI